MRAEGRSRGAVAAITALLCTGFLFAFAHVPLINDEQLFLPIARAAGDAGLYPPSDLMIATALRGPFFVYFLAGRLYAAGMNVELWWLGLLAGSLAGMFVAIWWIAASLTGDIVLASLATAIIAAAGSFRGTLHWFVLPPMNFVIGTLAIVPVMAAFAMAFRGRRGPALIVASLSFNLHPSMGLITAGAIGVIMLVDAKHTGWGSTLRWFGAALLCALPTALFVARSMPGNFAVPDATTFRQLFRLYSWHIFPQDHWREGYGFYAMMLGAFAFCVTRSGPQRDAAIATAVIAAGMAVAWINVFTIDNVSVDLLFLIRAAPWIKVFAWCTLTGAMALRWRAATSPAQRRWAGATIAAMLLAALGKNDDIAEGFAAIACALLIASDLTMRRGGPLALAALLALAGVTEILGTGWRRLGIAPFSPDTAAASKLATVGVGLVWITAALMWRRSPTDAAHPAPDPAPEPAPGASGQRARYALAATLAVFVLALGLRGRTGAFRPVPPAEVRSRARLAVIPNETRDVIDWVSRLPRGSLLAVPPLDERFYNLRLAGGQGLYIQMPDVILIAYDAAAFGEAHRRMLALGMKIPARHTFDDSAYGTLSADSVRAIAREGVDYAVFPAAPRATRPLALPVAYQDPRWIVYDVRSAR